MTKFLYLIIAIIFAPTHLFSETVIIYATQSAQYSANDCCTLNILTNQNSNSLYSQDCQDMGANYGCGMSKLVPFWIFDLSTIDSSIDIQSIQFEGNLPTESWSEVYLSISTTVGQISTTIASDLWSGGDWDSGNGQYSSINWPMGDFSQNLPLEIISQGVISGQLNILTYTSNPWTIFSIVNSGDDAPRLVINYENISTTLHVATTGSDGTGDGSLGNPFATIQKGIDSAIDGDTVLVAAGTYVENINYNGKNIAVIGEDRETTIIDGDQNGSVVTINGDSLEIILSDFTISNGNGVSAGGIIISSNNHNIYLSNLLVDNNISDCDYYCSGNGGGISIYGYNGVSLLEQLVVSNNVSRGESGYVGFGGGIYIGDQVNTSMKEVSIINNSQTSNGDGGGGGLYVGQSRINMEDCIIMNNYSYDESSDEGNGGGIYMFNSHDVIMNNVIIENNNSNRNGGGVAWITSGWENDAPFDSISMINVTIADNFAENGAGLYVAGGRVIFLLDSVSIDNNFAESEGGGLSFTGTFANNPENRPIVIGNKVLISNNIATFRYGGGINMDNSAFYLNSTSIVDNSISLEDEQIIRGGGITVRGDYVFEIENSIIWGNSAPAIYHYNVGADSLSINYSNVQDDGWSGEENIGLDPLFCNPDTANYNLHANSPCIGTGENGVNMGALGVGCEALILAPVLADIDDQQIAEDDDFIININAISDIGASMTFYAESDTSSVITFVEYAALIVTPEPDWYGSTNITVMVTDENDLSDTTDFTLTVTPVNDSPEDFNVLYPTVSDTFSTHVDSDTAIVFNWEESNDVDSDVTYTLTIELEFFGNTYTDVHENISDNTISISSNSLDPLLNVTAQDIATFTYYVISFDGEYMVASDVGEFVLFRAALGVNEGLSVPVVYALHQNYPNPFNPITTLQYDLPEDAMVNITIYDMMGRIVSNLVSSQQNAGYKSTQWNATNNTGQPVSAGLYLYTIQAGKFRQTKKMVLLK